MAPPKNPHTDLRCCRAILQPVQCLVSSAASSQWGQRSEVSFPIRNLYAASLRQCPDLSCAMSAASLLVGIILSFFRLWSLYVSFTRGCDSFWSLLMLRLMAALAELYSRWVALRLPSWLLLWPPDQPIHCLGHPHVQVPTT